MPVQTSQTPSAESTAPAETPSLAPELYGIFCGDINSHTMNRLTTNLTQASHMNVNRLHILFQTWGGIVGDGVYLYNLLQNFPLDVVLYNSGQVASIGAIAYLGAKKRKATANSIFMIHRSHSSPQAASAAKLKNISASLALDDGRTEDILKKHLKLPPELLDQLNHNDIYISGMDALKYGLVDEIAEFAPSPGTKVYNLLA